MLEITFSESAAGALKYAMGRKPGDRMDGPIGVIAGSKKEQETLLKKLEEKQKLGWPGEEITSNAGNVSSLSLMLDIGNISGLDSSLAGREALFHILYDPEIPYCGGRDIAGQFFKTAQKALARLEQAIGEKEQIRAWFCAHCPGEICGFLHLCHLLRGTDLPFSAVFLPAEEWQEDNTLVSYGGMGEIPPERLGRLARERENPVSPAQRTVYSTMWQLLVRENAPLRAVVNGRAANVPEDFYDFALFANLPRAGKECTTGQVIGKALGMLPGVGDRWLALRLEKLAESGVIEITAQPNQDYIYSGKLRRK